MKQASVTASGALDQAVSDYLQDRPTDSQVIDALINGSDANDIQSPADLLQQLRNLLAIHLLIRQNNWHDHCRPLVGQQVANLSARSLWQSFTLGEALFALNRYFSGQPHQLRLPDCSQGGIAPLIAPGRWEWAEAPQQAMHAELGFIWLVYGLLTEDQAAIDAGMRVADWQVNLLDSDGYSLPGLLSQDADHPTTSVPLFNGLLFRAASWASQKRLYSGLAERQLDQLRQQESHLPAWARMVWAWMDDCDPHAAPEDPAMTDVVFDPDAALVGYRSKGLSCLTTLSGGRSGLGAFRFQDVEVLAFGPQVLPLDRSEGFGILQGLTEISETETTAVATNGAQFQLTGTTRIAGAPAARSGWANYRRSEPAHTWLRTQMDFHAPTLAVRTAVTSLDPLDELAFCFYVRARQCMTENGHLINADSLQRYQGEVCGLEIVGDQGSLSLTSLPGKGQLQVIPLAGCDHFWGANYLIAHIFSPTQHQYLWQIRANTG